MILFLFNPIWLYEVYIYFILGAISQKTSCIKQGGGRVNRKVMFDDIGGGEI